MFCLAGKLPPTPSPVRARFSAAHSAPDMDAISKRTPNAGPPTASSSVGYSDVEIQFEESERREHEEDPIPRQLDDAKEHTRSIPLPVPAADKQPATNVQQKTQTPVVSGFNPEEHQAEEDTVVSSLTGAGFDQEIVEELHQALTELRAELDASRAEAARAVKVAEQAIQSAENTSSKDWNSTVTHKAAEAAALAQKRSAEAMAKQRLAEERLSAERKSAAFWRRQAEAAEEEAGMLQTRAAAAEVQRSAMMEELESERSRTTSMVSAVKNRFSVAEVHQRAALEAAMERTRALEIELDGTRRDLTLKSVEAKSLEEDLGEL